jgi:peptidoglycan/LPS O-acetylase OafA/YrhL
LPAIDASRLVGDGVPPNGANPSPVPTSPSGQPGLPATGRAFRLGHRPELDALRGLAVASVVVYHVGRLVWQEEQGWLLPGGFVGVDLFFALSGFLITALLLGEHHKRGRIDLVGFLRRRALRLVPALAVMMAALVVVSFARSRYSPGHVLSSAGWVLSFTGNLTLDRMIPEVGHTWSLAIEAHFYVVWCLTVAIVTSRARRPHRALAAIAAGGIVAVAVGRIVVHQAGGDPFQIYTGTAHRLDAPLIGSLGAVLLAAGWLDRVPPAAARRATVAALALLAVAAVQARPLAPGMFLGLYTGLAVCAAVAVVALQLAGSEHLRRGLTLRPLTALGTISYSVYLWHLPIFVWLGRNAAGWPRPAAALTGVAVTLAVSTLSYVGVERRFLRRTSRPAGERSPAVA